MIKIRCFLMMHMMHMGFGPHLPLFLPECKAFIEDIYYNAIVFQWYYLLIEMENLGVSGWFCRNERAHKIILIKLFFSKTCALV